MRRSPFYSYPDFPSSFYAPPAEAAYHRRRRAFPPSSPATPPTPNSRSVINVPVFDSAPSRSSSSPPRQQPIDSRPTSSPLAFSTRPVIDPSSAAIIIQSCFRGFCVRRHQPLLHLRSIANARTQLEELQCELKSPGFSLKMRASEKERLRFSESVMAIILRLDAIEGSIAEVRSQRKEATKKAIKLQDALDVIMIQKAEPADLEPTDGPFPNVGAVPDGGDVLHEQSDVVHEQFDEPLCTDVEMARGSGHAISKKGAMDVNTLQEESACPENAVAVKCISNLDKDNVMDMVDENFSTGGFLMGKPGYFDLVSQVMAAEAMKEAEQKISCMTGDYEGSDAIRAAEEEVNNGTNVLHLDSPKDDMKNNARVAKVDEDTFVDELKVASQGCVEMEASNESMEASNESYVCVDVVQETEESASQEEKFCPNTPPAEEKCDYPHHSNAAHENQVQCPSTAFERLPEDSPTVRQHGHETQGNVPHRNCSDKAYACDEVKVQPSTSGVGTSTVLDSALLLQLTEDSKQLRALVGKLLVQNKAQSKVLCTLAERLELLEHQQQLGCQQNRQNVREKRKLKKGSKRSVKYYNCE